MRRVTVIVGLWLAIVVAAGIGGYNFENGAASTAGWNRYGYREVLKKQIRKTARSRPGVIWLGDSTMLGLRRPSYPQILDGVVPEVTSRVLGFIGSDFFTYYPVVAQLVTIHRPGVLVMVAHLRLFRQPAEAPGGYATTRNDLVSMIPTAELPRALGLPFAARGVSIPRLLLARLLRYEPIERFFYFLEGAHALVAEADVPWLGPNRRDDPMGGIRLVALALAESDVSITREHPTVRMMEATVRLAHEAGVHVIVVGTPVPFENMRETVGYDTALYNARFATLRAAVEDAGGMFVDLHDALLRDEFIDPVGHFTVAGAEKLAERLRPIVARELHQVMWDAYMTNHPPAPSL
jgi:hypothetical protein